MSKIKVKIVIEILGSPKEHVEKTMKGVIEKLKNEKEIKMLRETTYEAEQLESEQLKNMWSTFSDIEIEIENISELMGLCFDYMPSSIDILEPHKMDLETTKIAEFMNDLLAKLHKLDMMLKNAIAENTILKKQLQQKK